MHKNAFGSTGEAYTTPQTLQWRAALWPVCVVKSPFENTTRLQHSTTATVTTTNVCLCLQTYETRVSLAQSSRFVVSVIFTNLTTEQHVRDLDFNILDSLNTKLMRGVCTTTTLYYSCHACYY